MLSHVNHRFLYAFLLAGGFAACSYEAPSAGNNSISSSSSSSTGGMGGAATASSSSGGGDGGGGLIPLGGMGGAIDVGSVASSSGNGGTGNLPMTTTSSSSSSSGSPPDPVVQNCGGADCPINDATDVCCKTKSIGGSAQCETFSGVCGPLQFALKCDDRFDCGPDELCCMNSFDRATCSADCMTRVVCKTTFDCPLDELCNVAGESVMFCGPK